MADITTYENCIRLTAAGTSKSIDSSFRLQTKSLFRPRSSEASDPVSIGFAVLAPTLAASTPITRLGNRTQTKMPLDDMQSTIPRSFTPEIVRQANYEARSSFAGESVVKGLMDLPSEILELIYHNLDSIDDVHSFGRTYSGTFHVIKRRTVYTEIMRSIIGSSQHHRYDLQLCRIIVLHRNIVQHFQQGGSPFPVSSSRSGEGYNKWEMALAATTVVSTCTSGPCTACMPDAVVHDILARYQGIRVLERIWMRRQLEEADLLSADATQDEKEFVHQYSCLLSRAQDFEQGDLEARNTQCSATKDYTRFNPDQRGRFYSAVIFVWILNELRWVLTSFVDPFRSYRHVTLLESCRADLTSLCHNPVLDELDRHSIFSFLYHHLLPLHSPVLQDQDSSKLPLTFHTEWENKDAQSSRYAYPIFWVLSERLVTFL